MALQRRPATNFRIFRTYLRNSSFEIDISFDLSLTISIDISTVNIDAPSFSQSFPIRIMFYRSDNRLPDQLRPVLVTPDFITTAEGSVLIEVGNTRVICTASIEEAVPQFLRNSGKGWISSEYSMLPRSTLTRTPREATNGRASGRT